MHGSSSFQVFSKSGDSAAEPAKDQAGGGPADKGADSASRPKPSPATPAPTDTDAPEEDASQRRKPLPEGSLGDGDVGRRIKARAAAGSFPFTVISAK